MNLNIPELKIQDYYPELKFQNLLKTILYSRNLTSTDIKSIFDSNPELPNHELIYDIKNASKIIIDHLNKNSKIVIHGDFDVDGVCATAILFDYLHFECKAKVLPIIPNRITEGYGMSESTIKKALDFGANLIITVDCGIKDYEIIEKYKDKIDFIITDHHQFRKDDNDNILFPNALSIIHTMHPKGSFGSMISGASTAWMLTRQLRLDQNQKEDISKLDLVALSTVCDVIPLTLENRNLLKLGLKTLKNTENIGLQELFKIATLEPNTISTYHLGFVLGPRLNATSRVTGDALDSLRLLTTRNQKQAQELAYKINYLNTERQELTQEYINEAESQINLDEKAIIIVGDEWPEGIIGLVAGKIAEKYYRPTFIITKTTEGHLTGSSRSPLLNFNIVQSLEFAKAKLERFGGHHSAAGFGSNELIFNGFKELILQYIESNTTYDDFIKKINIDLVIDNLDEVNTISVEELNLLEPYGPLNQKPVFLFKNCKLINKKYFGQNQNHITLELLIGDKTINGKIFNFDSNSIPELNSVFEIVGGLKINEWNNTKNIEIEIKEIID